jgi:hypothetical protein
LLKNQPENIVLIAHRGGIIGPDSPENSQPAIEAAALAGFQMVELDLRETLDHKAILLHAYGPNPKTSSKEFTLDKLVHIHHKDTSVPILSFRQGLELCKILKLGIIIDIKLSKSQLPNISFLDHINQCLEQTNFHLPLYCINKEEFIQQHLSPQIKRRLTQSELDRIKAHTVTGSLGKFWFGSPKKLNSELWKLLKRNHIQTIVAIEQFRYPKLTTSEEVRHDILRLKNMGIRYFHIDGKYLDFFIQNKPF